MSIDAKAMITGNRLRRTAKQQTFASTINEGRICGPRHVQLYMQVSQ